VELEDAMRTQHACRYYRDEPVPGEVLLRAVERARFAPNGGNRCAVRLVFVRDPELRRQLGEWYLPLWEEVVYPMAQNLCLALRDQGVATTFTTLLVAREADVKRLLGIPAHMATACHIVAGYPARPFPRRLHRPDVGELAFADRYGTRFTAADRRESSFPAPDLPARRAPPRRARGRRRRPRGLPAPHGRRRSARWPARGQPTPRGCPPR
jgi:nitroreductase